MELKYRGSTYQQQPLSFERTDKKLIGQYRGQACYKAVFDLRAVTKANPRLQYRGVEYGGEAAAATPIAHETLENSFRIELPHRPRPVRSSRHHVLSELDKVHNNFLLKNLELRLSSARQKGDQILVHMLEQEKEQLA